MSLRLRPQRRFVATSSFIVVLAALPCLRGQTTHSWLSVDGGSWESSLNWDSGLPGSVFDPLDTVQLVQDWAVAGSWTLDTDVTLNRFIYEDTGASGDVGGTLSGVSGETLAFGGTDPAVESRSSVFTLNVPVSSSQGLTKLGAGAVTLAQPNPGLSGTLTVTNPGATNGGGVYISDAGAVGGLTTVVTQGTPTQGGFFRLAGAGLTLPDTLAFELSGQGGNSAPNGTLVGSGTGFNVVAGPISLRTNGVRLSNVGASRTDFTGVISQDFSPGGNDGVLFRVADNEGIRVTNPGNFWTVTTIHSQGTLWMEPGALPAGSLLQLSGSANGLFQTKGVFDRVVGNQPGEVFFTNVPGGGRSSGFSARGGDLEVNLGGDGRDLTFYTFTAGNATRTAGSNVLTAVANVNSISVGMDMTGTGIPGGAKVTAVDPGASTVTLSASASAAGTTSLNSSLFDPTRFNMNTLWLQSSQADGRLTLVNPVDVNRAGRTIQVNANVAVLAGGLKNTGAGTATVTKTGGGTLMVPTALTGGLAVAANGGLFDTSPTEDNSFTGAVTVNGGTFHVRRSAGLGATTGSTTVSGGQNLGTLSFEASGEAEISTAENITLGMRASLTTGNAIPMVPHITAEGGRVVLTGLVNGVTGGAVTKISADAGELVIAGELRQSGASPTASSRVTNLQGSGTGVVSGPATQAAGITHIIDKFGTGTWSLTADSPRTGATRIVEGVLAVPTLADGGVPSPLGASAADAANLVFNGGTLRCDGAGGSTDRLFTINPGGGTLDASGTGPIAFTNGAPVVVADGTAVNGLQLTFANASTTVAWNDSTALAVGSRLSGTPGLPDGATITAINHSTGVATIDQPTLAASGGATGNAQATSVIERTLTLTGVNTGGNLLAAALSDSAEGGTLFVEKTGAGRWILSGTSTHTGETVVKAGRLDVAGALLASPVVVNAGGTLAGSGSVQSSLAVAGTVAPGDSVGELAAGALSFAAGATYAWEIEDWTGAAGTGHDVLTATTLNLSGVTGTPVTVRIGGTSVVNFTAAPKTFVLVSTTGGITGFASGKFTVDASGFAAGSGSWTVQQSGNDLVLAYSPATGTPYDTWAASAGLTAANNAPGADPDGDGVPNLLEFYTDGNPLVPSAANLPRVSATSPALVVTVKRRDSAAGLTAVWETSSSLATGSWQAVDPSAVSVVGNGGAADDVTVTLPVTAGQARYLRLRVTQP